MRFSERFADIGSSSAPRMSGDREDDGGRMSAEILDKWCGATLRCDQEVLEVRSSAFTFQVFACHLLFYNLKRHSNKYFKLKNVE